MTFDILDLIDQLEPDGGANHPQGDHSFHCPACHAPNFKIHITTGKWGAYGCECSSTEAGKQAIRHALSPAKNPNKKENTPLKPIRPKDKRSWEYRSEERRVILRVHRTDDGKGKRKIWQESLIDGCSPKEVANRVVPYGFHDAKQALKDGAPYVFIPEGEPCADALRRLGLTAVATLGGCEGFNPERDGGHFDPSRVVVVPDQDKPGVQYARKVAAAYPGCSWLLPYAGEPEWNGSMPDKGGLDVADWIADGATIEDVLKGVQKNDPFGWVDSTANLSNNFKGLAPTEHEYGKNSLFKQIKRPSDRGVRHTGKIWRVFDFAVSGVVLLAAEHGTGKTTLMNLLTEAIQEGTDFLGAFKVTQGKALLIQGDEPEEFAESKYARQDLKVQWHVMYPEKALSIEDLTKLVTSGKYDAIGVDSLTTVLCTAEKGTLDQGMVELLYDLNRAAVNAGVLVYMSAHLNKPAKDGNGGRRQRKSIEWADISGIYTICAAVQDCWGLTNLGGKFSLHALGKRNIQAGTTWWLHRDAETFSWWLAESQDQQLPADRELLSDRIQKHVTQHGYTTIDGLTKALKSDQEWTRICCCDLFERGILQRQKQPSNGKPKRGRPPYLYGVGDFSCATHTPLKPVVSVLSGEDDPHWPPRSKTA